MSSYPSYSQPPQGRPLGSGLAIASLVLGILAVVTFWTYVGGILLGLVAIVLGAIALGRVRRGRAAGRGMAIAGVVLGTLGLLFSAALIGLTAWVFNSDLPVATVRIADTRSWPRMFLRTNPRAPAIRASSSASSSEYDVSIKVAALG